MMIGLAAILAFQSCAELATIESGSVYQESDEPEAMEVLTEDLSVFQSDPVALNLEEIRRLRDVPGLPPELAESLIEFTRVFGPMLSRAELAAVESMSAECLELLMPIVRFAGTESGDRSVASVGGRGPPSKLRRVRGRGRGRLRLAMSFSRPLELRRGFVQGADGGFAGNALAYRGRVELNLGDHLIARLVLDQDAGEGFRLAPRLGQFGADLATGSLEIVDVGPLSKLIVGDYSIRFGYGLAVWSGNRRSGAGLASIPSPRFAGISARSGLAESGYLHGAAARVALSDLIAIEAFVSSARRDESGDSGLHRTVREIEGRHAVSERVSGASAVVGRRSVFLGIAAAQFETGTDSGHVGGASRSLGVTGSLRITHVQSSFEVGLRTGRSPSWVFEATFSPMRWIEAGCLIRHYPADASKFPSTPVGQGSAAGGTSPGWLTTIALRAGRGRLRFFTDHLVGSSFTSTRARPEVRTIAGVEMQTSAGRLDATFRVVRDRREVSAHIESGTGLIRGLEPEVATRSKLRTRIQVADGATIQLTLAASRVSLGSTATSLSQEIRWDVSRRISLSGGMFLFGVPDGATIYAFEPDVTLQSAWLRFSGAGSRLYLLLRAAPANTLTFQLKVGQTRFDDERDIGSGLDFLRTRRLTTVTGALLIRT